MRCQISICQYVKYKYDKSNQYLTLTRECENITVATMNDAENQVEDLCHRHGMQIGSLDFGTDHTNTIVDVAQPHMLPFVVDSNPDSDQN